MADSCRAFLAGDLDKSFSDKGSCHGRSKKIFSLINGVGLYAWENGVGNELLRKILYIELACACFQSSFLKSFGFFALSHVSAYGDYLSVVVVFLKPGNNNGSVKTSGICKYDFFFHND